MELYDELVARGLIAQVTNEEEIKKLINAGKAVFYIGFDPTADSLHVGHFMALCLMKRLQMAGNKPIALIGGGTATDQCNGFIASHLEAFHQAQCHEMTYMKTVCGWIEAYIEYCFTCIYQFFDFFFISYLGDETAGY